MKKFSVSLAVNTWETADVEAGTQEQALELARAKYNNLNWNGRIDHAERKPESDAVYGDTVIRNIMEDLFLTVKT